MSSEIEELDRLSVLGKVCRLISDHLGIDDRTLAEFVIHLAETQCCNRDRFMGALKENGAEFPASLADGILRIVTARVGGRDGKPCGGGGEEIKPPVTTSMGSLGPRVSDGGGGIYGDWGGGGYWFYQKKRTRCSEVV